MLIHFNAYFIILATCFGYVIAIIRPTRTVELALDAALSGMKHLLFASIIKIKKCGIQREFDCSSRPDDDYDVAETCLQYNKVRIKVY
jgi:hypothetical protein